MRTYEFMIYLIEKHELTDRELDRLYEAGCDDALVGSQGAGNYVAFNREAESRLEAYRSAAINVMQAGFEIEKIFDEETQEEHQVQLVVSGYENGLPVTG